MRQRTPNSYSRTTYLPAWIRDESYSERFVPAILDVTSSAHSFVASHQGELMTARFQRGSPYFPVADVAVTQKYYSETLGFRIEYSAGDPPEFAVVSRDGCGVMLRRVNDPARIRPMESQGGTWDAFFWVSDVNALSAELSSKGVTIVYPVTIQPYGMKEFAIRDVDGHVLGFGETA